jgi:hypothetical protein
MSRAVIDDDVGRKGLNFLFTLLGMCLARTMTFPNKPVPRTSWISYYFFLFAEGSCDIAFWETSEDISLILRKKGESVVIRVQKRKLAKKEEKEKEKTYQHVLRGRRVSRHTAQRQQCTTYSGKKMNLGQIKHNSPDSARLKLRTSAMSPHHARRQHLARPFLVHNPPHRSDLSTVVKVHFPPLSFSFL